MTDTEFVPIAELEVEMTVGELRADLTETCPDCCGSGYGGHPDSGVTCYRCGGSGGIAADTIDRQSAEIERLRQMAYVPGLWRCPKCNLHLTQKNLNTTDGTVTDRDTPGDRCPNCDVPLWRVSERENGDEMAKRCERLTKERDEARAEVERLRNALKRIAGDNWSSFHVDSKGAHIADQIVTEMRRIASEALSAPAKEAGHAE